LQGGSVEDLGGWAILSSRSAHAVAVDLYSGPGEVPVNPQALAYKLVGIDPK
jgi:hypothetical protein